MVKLRILGVILLGIVSFLACEKDDICVDGDTPLLFIDFYDIDDAETTKSVTTIRVVGEGQTSTVDTFTDRSTLETISIPLKTDENSTSFTFISSSADDTNDAETGNSDTITFRYDLGDEYVSRACGFIANYNGISAEVAVDTDNWIKAIEIVTEDVNLDNINTTHVKIYH